jgi:hypothetical protein
MNQCRIRSRGDNGHNTFETNEGRAWSDFIFTRGIFSSRSLQQAFANSAVLHETSKTAETRLSKLGGSSQETRSNRTTQHPSQPQRDSLKLIGSAKSGPKSFGPKFCVFWSQILCFSAPNPVLFGHISCDLWTQTFLCFNFSTFPDGFSLSKSFFKKDIQHMNIIC